jgi:hypothetical protein
MIQRKRKSSGQAFLSTILLMGGIMLVAGVVVAYLAIAFIDSGYGLQSSEVAEATATAGANDAFMRIVRNSDFSSTGYTLAVARNTANITVTQNVPSAGLATIFSTATVGGRTRKINVVISITSSTGQSTMLSWQEVQ